MTGFIYYETAFGPIKSVSMRPISDETNAVIEVEDDPAMAFLTGDRDIGQWTVDDQGTLVSFESLRIILRGGKWLTVPTGEGPVSVTIRTSPSSRYAEIILDAPTQMRVESFEADQFRFVMTRSGDPDSIIATASIPIAELNQDRSAIIHMPKMPTAFDILTFAFDDVVYRHDVVDNVSPVVPLPRGRFEDIVPMRRGTPVGSAIVAYLEGGRLHVRSQHGGGPRYDRGRDHLKVYVCGRGNPDQLMFHFRVSLEQLEKGDFNIGFSGLYHNVDLFTDLLYRDAFFSEHPCNAV